MKLGSYAAAAVLAYLMSTQVERARLLLDALIIIGGFYLVYALALNLSGFSHANILYSSSLTNSQFSGPFVNRNSFATYAGLIALCGCLRLFDLGGRTLIIGRGVRQFTWSAMHFVFGVGAVPLTVFVLAFATLVASASRGGFMAGLTGITVFILLLGIIPGQRLAKRWPLAGAAIILIAMAGLFMITGDNLGARLDGLVAGGSLDEVRRLLWGSAMRMIEGAPWLGLGLGTFEPAYPLYADRVMPFVMDKAHNDYLEFAAGLGLPAATAWWLAILWLVGMCIRGVFVRRRNRHYSMLAIAATALVAFHSIFDFSLQIPAIALTYAVILGLGVAQSTSTRNVEMDYRAVPLPTEPSRHLTPPQE
jgi:O-antigen ligase